MKKYKVFFLFCLTYLYYKQLGLKIFLVCLQTALGDNVWLQHKLVESLVDYNDIEEAARWAMFYHLPQSFLPPLVQQALDSW